MTGHFCAAGGVCTPILANGQPCTDGTQCGSTFCVDGVCCDSECAGTCEACTAVLKGSRWALLKASESLTPKEQLHLRAEYAKLEVKTPIQNLDTAGVEKWSVLAVGHRGARNGEPIEPHAMSRPFAPMSVLPAHPEPAGGNRQEVHAVEYSRRSVLR